MAYVYITCQVIKLECVSGYLCPAQAWHISKLKRGIAPEWTNNPNLNSIYNVHVAVLLPLCMILY